MGGSDKPCGRAADLHCLLPAQVNQGGLPRGGISWAQIALLGSQSDFIPLPRGGGGAFWLALQLGRGERDASFAGFQLLFLKNIFKFI